MRRAVHVFIFLTVLCFTLPVFAKDRVEKEPDLKEAAADSAPSDETVFTDHQVSQDQVIEELKLFSKAMGAILNAYVDDVEARELLYRAVKGMLTDLDKYTEFIDKERYELMKIHMKGEYAGIGALLEMIDDTPAIKEVQPGSLAEQMGVKVGDKILKVDGKDVKGMALPSVTAMIRGEEGVAVVLTLWREATKETLDIKLEREVVEVEAVKDSRMIGRAIGYVRISNFQENTAEQLDASIKELQVKGMQALIIDLRNNNGGLMKQAVALSERFLAKGKLIVSVKSKIKEQEADYYSSGEFVMPEYPLIILVNEASASSSEIFSAAMQDHKRGEVIGIQTYGKASVQSVIPLDDVTAMKMTTARYLSPKGRKIDQVGIEPNYVVPHRITATDSKDLQILKAISLLKKYM